MPTGQLANSGDPVSERRQGSANGRDRSATTHWLLCRSGAHRFALPVSQVIETMRMLPVQSIAGAPAPVLGLCIIRGAPTPVIETAALFGERRTSNAVLVTVRAGTRTVALAADAILGVQALAARELGQLPPLLSDVQAIAALTSLDEQLVFVLNAARVVPDDVLERCLSEGAAA